MKRTHIVRWSETSENDLKGIISYMAEDNPQHAYDVFRNIKTKISTLYSFPERGRIVPELEEQGITQYRELILAPWRIIYRTSEKTVYVLSVLDSRQNVEDILLKRLISLKL
jgi:plasmid stabilization system protein ParE